MVVDRVSLHHKVLIAVTEAIEALNVQTQLIDVHRSLVQRALS